MITLRLTERQAENLKDVLDNWLEGYDEATNDVVRDQSFESAEELLEQVDSIQGQFRDYVEIRQLLWIGLQGNERRN